LSICRRPPELDNPVWLRHRYEQAGDMAIALDLHVNRKTVRAARERLGILPAPAGPRRGQPARPPRIPDNTSPVVEKLLRRYHADQAASIPASWDLVLQRLAAADHAHHTHNHTMQINAAIALASATLLVADQLHDSAHGGKWLSP